MSGDTAAAHALAFCQAVEAVAGTSIPIQAALLRVVITELERLTMHLHDVANMCGMGTGYTVMAANGFRIKERLQRLSARLVGNRFFRGLIVPGGVSRAFTHAEFDDLLSVVDGAWHEADRLIRMGLDSDTLRRSARNDRRPEERGGHRLRARRGLRLAVPGSTPRCAA